MTTDYRSLAVPGMLELQPYQPGKPIETVQRELGLKDVVKLASNENPLGPSPLVKVALQRAMDTIARYPDGSAFQLKAKLAAFLNVQPETITMGNGSNDVLEILARVYLRQGSEALVSQHAFMVYPLVVKATGAELSVIPANHYSQDLQATLNSISKKTRMIFIPNPNNPTGSWIDEATLVAFLDQVRDDILVVLDEAYFEYVAETDYPNGIKLLAKYPNLVVTRTFSKVYGLAALRIGYAVSHPHIADLMNRVRQPFNVNTMSLIAAEVALDDQVHMRRTIELNRLGMVQLILGCDELGLTYMPSVGNFLTIDFGRDAMPIYAALLRQGVIVRPIAGYGLPNHLRVTVGLPEENQRFIESLTQVLNRYG